MVESPRLEVRYNFVSNLLVCELLIQAYRRYGRTQALPPWPRGSEQTDSRVAPKRKEGI